MAQELNWLPVKKDEVARAANAASRLAHHTNSISSGRHSFVRNGSSGLYTRKGE
jgi:hypothetical protein